MIPKLRVAAVKLALTAVVIATASTAFAQTHARHLSASQKMTAYYKRPAEPANARPTDDGSLVQSVRGIEGVPQ